CMRRLSLSDFDLHGLQASAQQDQYIAARIFLGYSAQYWTTHFRQSDGKDRDCDWAMKTAVAYCRQDLSAWFAVYQTVATELAPGNFSSLLVASYFGLSEVIEGFPKDAFTDVNIGDSKYART